MALPGYIPPAPAAAVRTPRTNRFRPVQISLPLRLALLVAGTMLPLIVFAAGIVYHEHMRARDAAFERVLETVRSIRHVLDAEMQSFTSALQVLALSQALQRDDIEGFRRDVDAFVSQYPENVAISLADRSGRQLFNTRAEPGQPLPPRANRETLDRVFRTGAPAYSRLITGSVSGRPIVTVDVPVFRKGEVVYDIAFAPALITFQRVVAQQRPTLEWTVAIFDQTGINFARVPNPEETLGRSASPSLLAELFKQPEAKLTTTSLEGIELITAFTRSPLTGWTIAGGIPTATVTAPLWRTLAITALTGGLLLSIGLFFAVRMAARVARAEALQGLLVNELNHRVKNTLATIQAIAWQTFRDTPDPKEARHKLDARLTALARTHDVLSAEKWHSADIREIVNGVIEPYSATDDRRLHLSGPELRLKPHPALMVSMMLHELATNAAKYGALSTGGGEVFIDWAAIDDAGGQRLRLRWQEAGGPSVQPTRRKGFGSTLIEKGFATQLGGRAKLEFAPAGVTCTLECPLE
jgi:two-component sensor histidine kinase